MKIAIIGAGLAGLAAAAFLARDGHNVEILERAPTPEPVGAGLLLQPPGIDILQKLGALQVVAEGAAQIRKIECQNTKGRKVLDVDYGDLSPTSHGLGLIRPAIWSALFDIAETAGVTITPNQMVQSIHSDADGATVLTETGTSHVCDLVVVASGTHSSLCDSHGIRKSSLYAWGCLWATVPLPPSWPTHVLQQRCQSAVKMVGILPIGWADGQPVAALYWSIRNDRIGAWRGQSMQQWVDEVGQVYPEATSLLSTLSKEGVAHATYRDIWVDPPYDGRVIVIGDAAHGTSPQLGQGTTQAFRDALTLTESLRLNRSMPEQLALYWQARKKRTRYYRYASRCLTPLFQTDMPLLGFLRDHFAHPIGKIPCIRKQAVLTVAGLKAGLFSDDLGTEVAG